MTCIFTITSPFPVSLAFIVMFHIIKYLFYIRALSNNLMLLIQVHACVNIIIVTQHKYKLTDVLSIPSDTEYY